jgi:membrane-bound ClpP family serine protease
MTPLIWATLVLCLGLMLLVAELFIPSGGVLGILTGLSLLGSIALAFQHSTPAGLLFLLVVIVALPTMVGVGLHLWPRTPIGRRMMLARPTPEDIDATNDTDRLLNSLVGKVGRTLTQLRPAGMTDFDGRRVDTVAEGMIIEQGELVRVLEVHGRRVVVRKLETNIADA